MCNLHVKQRLLNHQEFLHFTWKCSHITEPKFSTTEKRRKISDSRKKCLDCDAIFFYHILIKDKNYFFIANGRGYCST